MVDIGKGTAVHEQVIKIPGNAKGCVMVVDDDEDLLTLARAVLQRNGFQVHTRTSAPDWQDLRRMSPAVVFMDVGLGKENGIEACQAIKSNKQFASLPVVLISGQEESRLGEEAMRCHADAFLSKPFSADLLVQLAKHYSPKAAGPDRP